MEGSLGLDPVVEYHGSLLAELGLDRELIDPLTEQLRAFLQGVNLIRELTPRTLDHIMSFGERLSTRIIAAALSKAGVPATAVNAWETGLLTDARHGSASPLPGISEQIAAGISHADGLPVVTGFLGRNARGDITTLGRSGSDFTASILPRSCRPFTRESRSGSSTRSTRRTRER